MQLSRKATPLLGLAAFTALGLAAAPAHAQKIIVSGDTSIINPLDGSLGSTVNAGNQQFFKNVLGSGTKVIIQNSTAGANNTTANVDGVLNTFYNGLGGGVTSTQVTGPITAATLAGSNLFVAALPDAAFGPTEVTALSTFLNGGGTVFLLGETAGFAPIQDAFINTDLTALGSNILLTLTSMDPNFQTIGSSNIFASPLTTGVSTFEFAFTSGVSGGGTLFTDAARTPFVTAQSFTANATSTPEPSSVAAFAFTGLFAAGLMLKARKRKANVTPVV